MKVKRPEKLNGSQWPILKKDEVLLRGGHSDADRMIYSVTRKKIVSRFKAIQYSSKPPEAKDGFYFKRFGLLVCIFKLNEKIFLDINARRFEISDNMRVYVNRGLSLKKFIVFDGRKNIVTIRYELKLNPGKWMETTSDSKDVFLKIQKWVKREKSKRGIYSDKPKLKEGEFWLKHPYFYKGGVVYSFPEKRVLARYPWFDSGKFRGHDDYYSRTDGCFNDEWFWKIFFFESNGKFILDIGKKRIEINDSMQIEIERGWLFRKFKIFENGEKILSITYPYNIHPLTSWDDYPDFGDVYVTVQERVEWERMRREEKESGIT